VLQCVAECCRVLQGVAVHVSSSVGVRRYLLQCSHFLQCVAVCCSVLQCVAVCCNDYTSDRVVGWSNKLRARCVLQCVAVCCCVLQCASVCCSVLQCFVVCCSVLQ